VREKISKIAIILNQSGMHKFTAWSSKGCNLDQYNYVFSVDKKDGKTNPVFNVKIHDENFRVMAESGASVNILSEHDYMKFLDKPRLEKSDLKLFAYGIKKNLPVIGKLSVLVESCRKCLLKHSML
jgi:phage head maturation protease